MYIIIKIAINLANKYIIAELKIKPKNTKKIMNSILYSPGNLTVN